MEGLWEQNRQRCGKPLTWRNDSLKFTEAILASWRTSIVGLVLVLAGVALLLFGTGDNVAALGLSLIGTGIGFVNTRDAGVSSEQAGVK